MKKFLNIVLSVLVLFLTFVGLIYAFALSLVNFALCLPIVLVSFLFFKQKTNNKNVNV